MINPTNLSRREFLAALAAGGVVTAAGLWMPGTKLISIPKRIMVPPDHLGDVHLVLEGDGEPLPVGVNGRVIFIPRGEPVWVPEKFVHVLDNAVHSKLDEHNDLIGGLLLYPYLRLT